MHGPTDVFWSGPSGLIDIASPAAGWPRLLDVRGLIDALGVRRDELEREIVTMFPASPRRSQVGVLRCLRGVDTQEIREAPIDNALSISEQGACARARAAVTPP